MSPLAHRRLACRSPRHGRRRAMAPRAGDPAATARLDRARSARRATRRVRPARRRGEPTGSRPGARRSRRPRRLEGARSMSVAPSSAVAVHRCPPSSAGTGRRRERSRRATVLSVGPAPPGASHAGRIVALNEQERPSPPGDISTEGRPPRRGWRRVATAALPAPARAGQPSVPDDGRAAGRRWTCSPGPPVRGDAPRRSPGRHPGSTRGRFCSAKHRNAAGIAGGIRLGRWSVRVVACAIVAAWLLVDPSEPRDRAVLPDPRSDARWTIAVVPIPSVRGHRDRFLCRSSEERPRCRSSGSARPVARLTSWALRVGARRCTPGSAVVLETPLPLSCPRYALSHYSFLMGRRCHAVRMLVGCHPGLIGPLYLLRATQR
ncbi:MAG: hypothetical protein AVDCRST_MAG49-86 [uncultured Thermomicrobiales bacterium]|uniref:Uncharacterized protein n=1 Tax=uncultured Thermomicrobiales bacterium TaxID=1645740 RepID=A0A6J4TWK7_9BACT|nr:MAG: hypothetical protein AVDCRST_MAG49-86 [uncultured Thermomicrobiales bacterium]